MLKDIQWKKEEHSPEVGAHLVFQQQQGAQRRWQSTEGTTAQTREERKRVGAGKYYRIL